MPMGGEARPRVAKRVELVLELVEGADGLFGALPDARPEIPLHGHHVGGVAGRTQ